MHTFNVCYICYVDSAWYLISSTTLFFIFIISIQHQEKYYNHTQIKIAISSKHEEDIITTYFTDRNDTVALLNNNESSLIMAEYHKFLDPCLDASNKKVL